MSNGLACAACGKFMRVKKQGVCVEEGMPLGRPDEGGEYHTWGPYKLWMADLCECPGCGARVIAGFGQRPIGEHYESDYGSLVERFRPLIRINDCGGKRP